jgi:hypothetical protein
MSERDGLKILSWDSFVILDGNSHNYHSMIRIENNSNVVKANNSNHGLVRLAVVEADARYCGIYYGMVVKSRRDGGTYIILHDNWKGYPLEKGYMALLDDVKFPQYIHKFKHDAIKCMAALE